MPDRVTLEPAKRIQVKLAGQAIVDTARGYVVHELGLPDRYYVPRDDVRAEIKPGQGAAHCPWKGDWKHLDVIAYGTHIANGAWTYYSPTPLCEPIRDFIAFYETKVQIEVG